MCIAVVGATTSVSISAILYLAPASNTTEYLNDKINPNSKSISKILLGSNTLSAYIARIILSWNITSF